jgi:hypothetical protein
METLASDGRMMNGDELEGIWKERVLAKSRHYHGIAWRDRKNHEESQSE